jgi:hypothetical protein
MISQKVYLSTLLLISSISFLRASSIVDLASTLSLLLTGVICSFALYNQRNNFIKYAVLFMNINFSIIPLLSLWFDDYLFKLNQSSSILPQIFLLSSIILASYASPKIALTLPKINIAQICQALESKEKLLVSIGFAFLIYKAAFPRQTLLGATSQMFALIPASQIVKYVLYNIFPLKIKQPPSLTLVFLIIVAYVTTSFLSTQRYYLAIILICFVTPFIPFIFSSKKLPQLNLYNFKNIGILLAALFFLSQPISLTALAIRHSYNSIDYGKLSINERIALVTQYLFDLESATNIINNYKNESLVFGELNDVRCTDESNLIKSYLNRFCLASNYIYFASSKAIPRNFSIINVFKSMLPSQLSGIKKAELGDTETLGPSDEYLNKFTSINYVTNFIMTSFADSFLTFGFAIGLAVTTIQWSILFYMTYSSTTWYDPSYSTPHYLILPILINMYGQTLEVSALTPSINHLFYFYIYLIPILAIISGLTLSHIKKT